MHYYFWSSLVGVRRPVVFPMPNELSFPCRCDVIASGVLNAAKNIGMKKPIIIRLKGTNVKEAKKLIAVRTAAVYIY
jgi:succinyl-CoA synthetase beta subunit